MMISKTRRAVGLLMFMSVLASLACSTGGDGVEPTFSGDAQSFERTLRFDGVERSYLVRLPAGYQETDTYPLVIALHGGGGSAERMCSLKAGVHTLADDHGFLVVCPQAVEKHWNDGRLNVGYAAHQQAIDDVGFLTALIDELTSRYSINAKQIFVTGFSNGGMMAFRLACQRTDLFAAVAAGIANLPQDLDCQPSRPIPILVMNGTNDPLMPHLGGQVGTKRNPLGSVLSTEATAAFWAEANGCDMVPMVANLPVQDQDDPTRLSKKTYMNCQEGAAVVLYTIEGGGHTWPGGPQYAPKFMIGPTSNQASAADLIWGFFSKELE